MAMNERNLSLPGQHGLIELTLNEFNGLFNALTMQIKP
jgi:hypothetical protein